MGGKRPGRGAPAKRSVPAVLAAEGAGVGPRGHPAELRMWPLLVVITPQAGAMFADFDGTCDRGAGSAHQCSTPGIIGRGHTVTGVSSDLPTEVRTQSAGARRMARHRDRRRKGLRCITVEIWGAEIDALVRRGRLATPDSRADLIAVRNAL